MDEIDNMYKKTIDSSKLHRFIVQKAVNEGKYLIDESTGNAILIKKDGSITDAKFGKGYLNMASYRSSMNTSGFSYIWIDESEYKLFTDSYYELTEAAENEKR